MGQYKYHVFVCALGKDCGKAGGMEVFQAMKREVREARLGDEVRINKAGCMDQCGHGPMVVVYPQDVWYSEVDEKAGRKIVKRHLKGGEVVRSKLYGAAPGENTGGDEE